MFELLSKLFSRGPRESADQPAGSGIVSVDGSRFDFAEHAHWHDGIPYPDWSAVLAWHNALPEVARGAAWLDLQRGWLQWLRGALGLHYRLYESDTALMLTTQSERLARLQLDYLDVTQRRIRRALEELADHGMAGKEVLIAFPDSDEYYRYLSAFYAEDDLFAMSAGVHLNPGCSHFAIHGSALEQLEPTIVHEMTHSRVTRLSLPLWLDEGIAQSIEERFAPGFRDPAAAWERSQRQAVFWTPESIQEFWNGQAFQQLDKRQEMAYDLAYSLVKAMAQDWPRFKAFVLTASNADGGSAAARDCFGVDLGEYVRLALQQSGGDWSPRMNIVDQRPHGPRLIPAR